MESITVPTNDNDLGPLAEVAQVTVGEDNDVSPVNALLADGWKLLHIGHTGSNTVYVLSKPPAKTKRHTGFLA